MLEEDVPRVRRPRAGLGPPADRCAPSLTGDDLSSRPYRPDARRSGCGRRRLGAAGLPALPGNAAAGRGAGRERVAALGHRQPLRPLPSGLSGADRPSRARTASTPGRISWPGTKASTLRPSAARRRRRRGPAWRPTASRRRCSARARRRRARCASAISSPRTPTGPRAGSSSSSTRRRRCCGGRNCWSIRTAPCALRQCLFVSDRPDNLAARLGAFGADPASCAVLSDDAFAEMFPGETAPPLPCMAGHVIAFADLDRAIRLIEGNGVAVGRDRHGTGVYRTGGQ